MLTYEEALKQILQQAAPLPTIELPLEQLLGFVLADPVVAEFAMPQFDNSAVDGFGVLLADTAAASADHPVSLKLSGEIQAGTPGNLEITAGSAIKILTGAVVPDSVDAVVMGEYCQEKNGSVTVGYAPVEGENVRRRGTEFEAGAAVLPAGLLVTPPVVGLLASLGYRSFPVHRKPSLAIIATGDELVEPGKPLQPGQIYDSNSFALGAALSAIGISQCRVLHASDSAESTRAAFQEAFASHDVIISTGGVSVGDYDFVKDVLESLGVRTVFWRIAIKPGKPVYFGVLPSENGNKLIFGLPGNPVSGLVTYHQFVKPALRKLMGSEAPAQKLLAKLRGQLKKKPGRLDFVRGIIQFGADGQVEVRATQGQDSHMISGLAKANSLIHFDADADRFENGTNVTVDLINWWQ
jgi:molybdopterin molybdotransferase